jgi:hypothetical protein
MGNKRTLAGTGAICPTEIEHRFPLVVLIFTREGLFMPHRLKLTLVDGGDGSPLADGKAREYSAAETESVSSDSRGVLLIELPALPNSFALRVRKEGFVPRLVVWDFRRSEMAMPDQFTLKMERSRAIGGIVRNQEGEPVQGANVLICLRGSRNRDRTGPRIENDIWEVPASTDSAGRWKFHGAPENLEFLHVRLEHREYISNEHIAEMPPADDFKNETAILILHGGVPCEGTVTDARGRPIEGVEVISGALGEGSPSKPTRMTDAEGHYRFGGISMERQQAAFLSFRKEGYAPELIELRRSSILIRQDMVLPPGNQLRVRFTDKEGASISDVMMAVNYWRKHRPFHLAFQGDAEGFLTWEDAPADAIGYSVLRESYQPQEVKLTAAPEVQTVVLQRHGTISGRVVDAQTKQPVPVFRLTEGRIFHERRERADWSYEQARTFCDGQYKILIGEPAVMMNREGGPGDIGFHLVRVDADGYRPGISRAIANDEERVECDFEIERGAGLEGTVRDSDGTVVAKAEVIVLGSGSPVMVRNGEVQRNRHFSVPTNEEGRYALPPQEHDSGILVIHPRLGYLVTKWNDLSASPDMQLLAWGTLDVATTATEGSEARYYVRPASREDGSARIRFDSSPVLGPEGSWVFKGLPAGPFRLGTYHEPMDSGPVVTIENGRMAHLDFRSRRRTVVGQVLLPSEKVATEAPLAHLRLRPMIPDPPSMPTGLDDAARREWFRAYRETPEGQQRRRESFEKTFKIDLQGRFRVDDLVHGQYKITAVFFRSIPNEAGVQPDIAGFAVKDFKLVAGEGEFDVGILPVMPPGDTRRE